MKTQIIGYIVTTEYFGEPLELCDNKQYYPWPVLLRGDVATVFKTRKAASATIDKTIEWAGIRDDASEWPKGRNEDENLKPPKWADKYKYKIWRLCPTAGIAEAKGSDDN